jgi:anthranilate phosphoribosyltransferase
MMAPKFHTAMRHVAPVRMELGIRTIFNLLGPLCNPASTQFHLLGVFDHRWVEPLAQVLKNLGSNSAWVVHGADGMDELSTTGVTHVAELKDGHIRCFDITPEEVGLARTTLEDLQGGESHYNARRLKELLHGERGAYRDIVLYNAGAALLVAGKVEDLKQGIHMAAEAIDSGRANSTLEKLVDITNRFIIKGHNADH